MKNFFDLRVFKHPTLKKLIMEMKIAFLIIVVSVSNLLATDTYSQVAKVTLDLENKSLEQVMDEIERQSEFYFIFNQKQIDVYRVVDIQADNKLITDILPELFKGTNVNYAVFDRKILLTTDALESKPLPIAAGNDLQQKLITGRVTDAGGNALPGVNIQEKGTINGTITNADGSFSISVSSASSILSFSFIGYTPQDIAIGAQVTIAVVLEEVLTGLDEIVIVGYSTQARKTLTGSVSTVNSVELTEGTSSSAITRLQGKASGVSVITSHTPGADPTIRIRGMGTINDSDPLWIVDGVPGGAVSPNEIESISILKDAAAQAIYGARAANGVVLVTTKSGKKNQAVQINVNVRQGITRNINYYDMLNTQEFGEMYWLEAKNGGITNYSNPQYGNGPTPVIPKYIFPAGASTADLSLYDNKMDHEDGDDTYIIMEAAVPGTKWIQEADRDAMYSEYVVDISGGGANTTYAFQAGYLNEEGIFKWTGFDRYNLRSNITTNPAKWIEIGQKVGINYSTDYGYQYNDNNESSIISWSYRMHPIVPVYDVMGNYSGTRAPTVGGAEQPIFLLDKHQDDFSKRMNITGNFHIKFNILSGLSFSSLVGVNHFSQYARRINFNNPANSIRGKYDILIEDSNYGLQWSWTNTIEYSKTIANSHNLKIILGSEAIKNNSNFLSGTREDFFSKEISYIQLSTGLKGINNSGNLSAWSLFSMFGRFNYTFSDKYMLEGVVRRDGSSRFGGTNKYGIFPAFSVGWRISNENFMASTSSWLNELKLRAGYGTIGNDRMGNYNSYTSFNISPNNSFYPLNGSNSTTGEIGFYQETFGNPDVRWETTKTTNIGFDATLIRKFSLIIDLWQRVTSEMLYPKNIPMILGRASAPSINIGEMKNRGFDIELGYISSALNGDLNYDIGLIISHYKNEIVKLTDKEDEFMSGSSYREMIYTRSETGHAFPEFYGYVVEGIFQTQAEADEHAPAFGAAGTYNKPGHYKFKDVNNDGVLDASDRTYIGSPHPIFTAGFNINLSYKGFNLFTQLYTSYGNEMVNYVRRFIDFNNLDGARGHARLYESWGSPYLNGDNSKATLPLAELNDIGSQQPSTAFIDDASYLRMRNLRFGYDLNNFLGWKFRSLRVYGQVSNVFTLTKYPGLDPEVGGTGINMGIDSGAWPTPRQFIFGISLDI